MPMAQPTEQLLFALPGNNVGGGDSHVKVRGLTVGVIHHACESVYNTVACTIKLTTMQCGTPRLHELCQWKSEGAQPLHLQIWGGLSTPCPPPPNSPPQMSSNNLHWSQEVLNGTTPGLYLSPACTCTHTLSHYSCSQPLSLDPSLGVIHLTGGEGGGFT